MVDHAEDSSCPLPMGFIVSWIIFFALPYLICRILYQKCIYIQHATARKIHFNMDVDSDFSTPKLAKCIMTGIKIAVHNEREEILT